ncbi:hypothetical protein Xbed_01370 [Xenorhabdus beddingii]|uniref:Uncharacterized protein n=1 Tax=Xenorhabdus beddingii TaxID=40578 RepID=A0A1Y2SNI3_9GAMM|nr:hypothetical protein [Xenorhabdus beddingii]OTA20566.1 hypothetical protein Xbed_01370 [Xenorhabdus beddingii]
MNNDFDTPFKGKTLAEQVTNPNIQVGRFSDYSGYYHGYSFDECARYCFSGKHIALLLEMQWWNWPLEQLKAAMKLITSPDIETLYRWWKDQNGAK